jgi:hypothetical protein
MADSGTLLQRGTRNHPGSHQPIGRRRGDRIRVAKRDQNRDMQARQAVRVQRLYQSRRHHESRPHRRDGMVIRGMLPLRRHLRVGKCLRHIGFSKLEFPPRTADAVVRVRPAERDEMVRIDRRPRLRPAR